MEQSALNQIFQDAARQQRTRALIRLQAPRPNRLDTRRPPFDDDEWEVLTRHLHDWAEGINFYQSDKVNAYYKKQRQQLRAFVLFLANSGLRIGEARMMRWADIGPFTDKADTGYLKISVRADTKQGTARTVIPMPDVLICLSDWLLLSRNPVRSAAHLSRSRRRMFRSRVRRRQHRLSEVAPIAGAGHAYQSHLVSPSRGRNSRWSVRARRLPH